MSTVFRVVGRGARLTLPRIRKIAKGEGAKVEQATPREANRRVLVFPRGALHLYRTGKTAWNEFEVFGQLGGNGAACDVWLDALFDAGVTCISEHDEGFFR